ncbi:porin family protein [Methylobacterium sp. SD274]|uniref:outer membrane protein n=1 Tax=Methylobacterium sp. SD274 TaxID=2782009 RepID=UPI001A978818|nr:outer membrane beta-barrel protein [Methylobacterium sp. SD274]MBO1022854.1 porin family protein [Methylobacterium sp. SD274]
MAKIVLGVGAMIGLMTGTVAAADLPRRSAPPPVFVPVPAFSWTGFYAGVQAGYGFTERQTVRTAATSVNGSNADLFIERAGIASLSSRQEGFVAGGQAGYNYQFTPGAGLVLGIETDIAYTDLDETKRRSRGIFGSGSDSAVVTTTRQSLDFLGTVRGRLGYAFDRVLVYGTGGLAYGNVNYQSASSLQLGGAPTLALFAGGIDRLETGFAYGGGIEYALPTESFLNVFRSSAVTLKVEYLHYDLGKRSVPLTGSSGLAQSLVEATSRFRSEGSVVRVGLNYKFGS